MDLAPPRIEQRSSGYRPTGDGVFSLRVDPADLDSGQWFQRAMQSMLTPECPQLHGSDGPPERYYIDLRDIISTWSSIANLDPGDYGGGSVLAPEELHSVLSRWEVCNLE